MDSDNSFTYINIINDMSFFSIESLSEFLFDITLNICVNFGINFMSTAFSLQICEHDIDIFSLF